MKDTRSLPFNPWTATEKEAKEEDTRRQYLRIEFYQGLQGLDADSKAWKKARYKLEPFLFSAVCQRKTASRLKKKLEKIQSLSGLEVVEIVVAILEFGLPAPNTLSNRFHEITRPLINGKLKDWNKAFGSPILGRKNRQRWSHGISQEIYFAVEDLIVEFPGKFAKRLEPRKDGKESVFEAIADCMNEYAEKKIKDIIIKDIDGKRFQPSKKLVFELYQEINSLSEE